MNTPEGFAHRVEQAQAARDQKAHDAAAKALSKATNAVQQVSALVNRIKDLEGAQEAAQPVDLTSVTRRLQALEDAPDPEPVDLTSVERRLTALENAEPPAPAVDLDNLVQRLEALEALHGRPKKTKA